MTVRDSYPLPVIGQLLNNLHGCSFLSKVDLKAAFNLLRVAPGHEWKTAFRTPWGLFEYQVMPFGLANAPATFQRFIQHVLREYLDVCCFVYIDDILIFSRTKDQHLIDLRNILAKLREHSLKASLKKCEFFCTQVTFLGFDITERGLKMNRTKLSTIDQWPFPSSLRELRRFLGFTNFYRRFIPRFSSVAGALTSLTKGDFGEQLALHTSEALIAFENLKQLFVSEPLLLHFDFAKDRILHVDSSGFAIAAVLSQPDDHGNNLPVSYFSRKLNERERSWQIFDLELLAIVSAFEEWRAWLMGTDNPVTVYSDHSNLLYFKTAKYLSPKQARWASYLDNFNMQIFHIVGSRNPADAPSRREDLGNEEKLLPDSKSIATKMITVDSLSALDFFHDLQFQRPNEELLDYLKRSYSPEERADKSLKEKDSVLWHGDRIFVPKALRVRLMKMYHDAPTVGHPGSSRTLSALTRTFSWPGVRRFVLDYVRSCDSCQRVKARRQAKDGKLIPIVPGPKPWSTIGMDMITKLPLSGGFDSILVVIDLLSKLTHFIPCKEASSSMVLAGLFRKNIFRLHGLPDRIVSDRGSTFVSGIWKCLMVALNIKSALSTAYHPQTDGQTERMNQVLEDYLRHFCSYYQDNWDKCLDMAEFSINNMDSASLGVSPFFFCNGHHPKFNILTTSIGRKPLDEFLLDLQLIQETAMECLIQARKRQAKYYNANKKESPVYVPGEEVLLLRKFIKSRRLNSKLDYRYLGPFKVKEMVGKNAVSLLIANEYPKLHPVFNVGLVVKYMGPNSLIDRGTVGGIKENYYRGGEVVDWTRLKSVLDVRMVRKGKCEFLLSWTDATVGDDTWVAEEHLPARLGNYLEAFKVSHARHFGKIDKKV
ncbi:hypothetical protein Pst134EB_033244 [Puccinia striiformis f. sp. tritici]|nr:hypothetical protein Pst134EB_033244 [Puccinia striiformis f. sp. tritici]